MAARKSGWLWLILLIAIISIAFNVAHWAGGWKSEKASEGPELYTCPMHPQVVQDHPGDCPICGMKLVKKMTTIASDAATDSLAAAVNLSPSQEILANIATEIVKEDLYWPTLSVPGSIRIIEGRQVRVVAKSMGRIERIMAPFAGSRVEKNQPLYVFFSPDLNAAQRELFLVQSQPDSLAREALLRGAKEKLLSLGLDEQQVESVVSSGRLQEQITFNAPVSGIVMEKMAVQGDWIMPGMPILDIVDISMVWAEGVLRENDLLRVNLDDQATITTEAYPGVEFRGLVAWIAPMYDMMARTVPFYVLLENFRGDLKPGMFVNITIRRSEARRFVMVPAATVLQTGEGAKVWIKVGPGRYQSRSVEIGAAAQGRFPVWSGLAAGEEIVTQGAYLIDSDSQIRSMGGGMATMPGMEHGDEAGEKPGGKATPGMEMPPRKQGVDTLKSPDVMDMMQLTDPAGHNATPAAPRQGGKIEQEVYTCPMHSEVISDKPGKCPKCGMDLVKKAS